MEQAGVSAITCYLHACRHQNEHKSRKYLAKVLWLLSYDDEQCTLADALDKVDWKFFVNVFYGKKVLGYSFNNLNKILNQAHFSWETDT